MARSACAANVSVSVALLLPGVGSAIASGATTSALLTSVPVAAALIVADAVYVTDPPAGRLTVSLMFPLPLAVQVPPPAPAQVQVAVRAPGKVSTTVAPVAAVGPALEAVMV